MAEAPPLSIKHERRTVSKQNTSGNDSIFYTQSLVKSVKHVMKPKRKCKHLIIPSKYERNSLETQNWWYELYDRVEAEAAIPPDKRIEVLNDIFPLKILRRILSILSLPDRGESSLNVENFLKQYTVVKSTSTVIIPKSPPKTPPAISLTIEEQPKKPSSMCVLADKRPRTEVGPVNPYLNFFRRRPDRAAIWHTLPPLSYDEMNLGQKAYAITESIARDFVTWMISISDDDSPTQLTVAVVLKMFEIGFDTHAAKSLQVRVKELVSIPDAVALIKNVQERSKRSQLHKQLLRDLAASKKERRVFAFGTEISPELQIRPPNPKEITKWLICDKVPKRLETMAAVWQGITHLRSTRAFCEYLLSRDDIKPPQYLLESNMLDPLMLRKAGAGSFDAGAFEAAQQRGSA